MSEHVDIPESWLAYAVTVGIKNPRELWVKHCNWMSERGHEVTDVSWKRLCDRRKPAQSAILRASGPEQKRVLYKQPDWGPRASREESLKALEHINAILDRTVVR